MGSFIESYLLHISNTRTIMLIFPTSEHRPILAGMVQQISATICPDHSLALLIIDNSLTTSAASPALNN